MGICGAQLESKYSMVTATPSFLNEKHQHMSVATTKLDNQAGHV
jgi:hypothetical protein